MQPLLYLTHRIPFPPDKGDKVRSYHLLRYLATRYRVFLGTFVDDPEDRRHADRLTTLCAEVFARPLTSSIARTRSLAGFFTGEPLTLPYYRDRALRNWVDAVVARERIRRSLVFSSAMIPYVLGRPELRVVADLVDVDSDKWTRYARTRAWPLSLVYGREGRKLLAFERAAAARADATVLVTEAETRLFAALAPECAHRVHPLRNGVDAEFFSPAPGRESPYGPGEEAIVFTGAMDYWPNVDAVAWFAREALPRIAAVRPRARFYIVGRNPSAAVRALARDGRVVVTGRVPDVRPYLQHARVVVAPLRLARGIQNKVLEAMAMGRPVVASAACAAVLSFVPGSELETADCAEAFAAKTIELISSPRREAMGAAARVRILKDYAWERSLARLADLLEGAVPTADPEPREAVSLERVAAPDQAQV
jgi:sugar transferase (PEP-CTERM/EpsH1 system associated)